MLHFIVFTLTFLIYTPSFIMLYSNSWGTIDYIHAYFILPVSLWLSWRSRYMIKETFQQLNSNKNISGLIILIIGVIILIFGRRQGYLSVSVFSLLPVLFGLISYLYGIPMIKTLWFPLCYLLLLIPPPLAFIESITLPMRYGISEIVVIILKHLHYPIYRDGLLLTIGYNKIFMGPPFSGFSSLLMLFSLGLIYVYIRNIRLLNKFLLSTIILPLGLMGNLVRIIIMCLITFHFGEEVGQAFFHNFSGILMFIITILGLIGLESFLKSISKDHDL